MRRIAFSLLLAGSTLSAVQAQEVGACCRDDGTCVLCTAAECICVGDCNCDGRVDFADINAFVSAIEGAPQCLLARCDINGDGQVDFRDINPFVTLLATSGGDCPGGPNGRWLGVGSHCERCCWLTPPPGCVLEGEPPCTPGYMDHYNGGCWSNPPVFQPLEVGQTLFGHTGVGLTGPQGLDADYYQFTLSAPTRVRATLRAEVGTHFCLERPGPGGGCTGLTVIEHWDTEPCLERWLDPGVLPAGDYWIFICGSMTWECQAAYILTLTTPAE